jgi:hypothetical protein
VWNVRPPIFAVVTDCAAQCIPTKNEFLKYRFRSFAMSFPLAKPLDFVARQ